MGLFSETSVHDLFKPLAILKPTLKEGEKSSNVLIASLFLQEIMCPSTDSIPLSRFDSENRIWWVSFRADFKQAKSNICVYIYTHTNQTS